MVQQQEGGGPGPHPAYVVALAASAGGLANLQASLGQCIGVLTNATAGNASGPQDQLAWQRQLDLEGEPDGIVLLMEEGPA